MNVVICVICGALVPEDEAADHPCCRSSDEVSPQAPAKESPLQDVHSAPGR